MPATQPGDQASPSALASNLERPAPTDPRRHVPRTDSLLADPRIAAAVDRLGKAPVRAVVLAVQNQVRRGQLPPEQAAGAVLTALPEQTASLRHVLNATGVILHTNLGRAPLSPAAVHALRAAAGYVDLEFDLATGQRSRRGQGAIAALLAAVPVAADALVVNNGAAALLLAMTVMAGGREVVMSRGEMVEIGDGFRLPELIEAAGAHIREVGTTNRTTANDFRGAVGERTGCLLKVHPSNFRIEGFTAQPSVRELADLGVPVVVDIGSGLLRRTSELPDEPDVASALSAGAALVTASGDKLLGGPQAGLLFGQADLIARLRRHPLYRALRADKLRLAALEATVAGPPTLVEQMWQQSPETLHSRCIEMAHRVAGQVVESQGAVGGGGAPGVGLPGWAVRLPVELAERLRLGRPAVVGRVEHGALLLDLRCVPAEADSDMVSAVLAARG